MPHCSINSFFNYDKIIIEIGSGDGRLLNTLAKIYHKDDNVLFIGIEIDECQYQNSCTQVIGENVKYINGAFENVLADISNNTVDTLISVLPHPDYIDITNQQRWIPVYKTILSKIKYCGYFILVTELTDELLEPVSTSAYNVWKAWVIETFSSIGFDIVKVIDGAPLYFSSHCLDKFKNDPQRIKIITLVMTKQNKKEQ